MNKKLFLLVLWVMAAFMPAVAQQTLTVCDSTAYNSYLPTYGLYADNYNKAEYIIPADSLANLDEGAIITNLTWYLQRKASAAWSNANFKVFIREVENDTLTAYYGLEGATLVYEGALNATQDVMTIELDQPYTYNGKSLLIGIYNTQKGSYSSSAFYGIVPQYNSGAYGYNANSLDQATFNAQKFIPKTTFTYLPAGTVVYYKPQNLEVTDITTNTAKVTWDAGSTETKWNVEYKKAADEEWTSAGAVSEKNITLDALANNTNYEVRVQGDYGDGNLSEWITASFTTLKCDDMGYITCTMTDSYGDGWNGAQIQVVDAATNEVIETLTLASGSTATVRVGICLGDTYKFVWVKGSYPGECSFTITDPFEEEIFTCTSGSSLDAGEFASYTYKVITCKKPTELAASNVVYNGATLTWTAGDEEQDAWQVLCAPGEFDPEAIELIPTDVTGEPTLALTGLTENTTYTAYVRGNCGENDKSTWSEVCTFTTPLQFPAPDVTIENITAKSANAIWEGNAESYKLRYRTAANLEKFFFESFESALSGWTTNAWGRTNISGSTMGGVPLAAADGNYCIASSSIDDSYNYLSTANWLISPQVELKGTLILYAADLGEDYEENFSVYVSTSGTEEANFTPLGENIPTPGVVPASSDIWGKHTFDLSAYEGQQGYIAICHNRTGNSGYYLFIDAVTIAGADIPAGEWVTIDPATSPQALEGLTPSTTYEVEAQAVYADGASLWSEPVEFTTLAADANPNAVEVTDVTDKSAKVNVEGSQDTYNIRYRKPAFFDDFENGLDNWTIKTNGTAPQANGWYVINPTSGLQFSAYSGSYVASSWSWNNSAYNANNWLITPQVTFDKNLSFMVRTNPSYPDSYEVLLSTTDNAEESFTVTLQEMAAAPAVAEWTEVSIDLSQYVGQQGYIAIHHVSNDMNYLVIDNFSIGGDWTVVEGVETPYTIESLDSETEYEVQVQGVVDEETTTEWTASELFTTLEAVPEYGEFYLVGTFNEWNQLEDGGRIELLANADGTEYSAPVTLAQGDRFKIITFDKDGNMIWIGAESNGYFVVLPDYYGSTPITLIFGDEGQDFEMQEGGNFKITVKAAPAEEPVEPSGIAPKAVAEPLVMVIDKITGIETIDVNNAGANEWYNLNGQKLNGKPTVPGIYINGHRKVVVK